MRDLIIPADKEELAFTISHFSGKNSEVPSGTYSLTDANPNNVASADMACYQFFRITGLGFKLFFPPGTEP